MKSIDILEFLARLHIANKEKVAALEEGIRAIKILEKIRTIIDESEAKLKGKN
jgi:hypothetical protein